MFEKNGYGKLKMVDSEVNEKKNERQLSCMCFVGVKNFRKIQKNFSSSILDGMKFVRT